MKRKSFILIDIVLLAIPYAVLTWGKRGSVLLYIVGILLPLLVLILNRVNELVFCIIKAEAERERERKDFFAFIVREKDNDAVKAASEVYRPFVLPIYIKIIVSGWNAIYAGPGSFKDRSVIPAPV